MARPVFGSVLACAAVAVAALVGGLSLAPAPAQARNGSQLSTLQSGVLDQINFIRTQHGLVPLRLNVDLGDAATEHTDEMAADGYFQHDSADGSAFWQRIARYFPSAGYGYWAVGENLLWSSPSVGPAGALQLWMRSPEHRANILAPRWREIGIAAVHVAHGPGTFRNLPVTIITTDFGVRR